MSLQKLISTMSRLFFLGAFVLLGLAVIEKICWRSRSFFWSS